MKRELAGLIHFAIIATLVTAGVGACVAAWVLAPLGGGISNGQASSMVAEAVIAGYVAGPSALLLGLAMMWSAPRRDVTERGGSMLRIAAHGVAVGWGILIGAFLSFMVPMNYLAGTLTERVAADMLAFQEIREAVSPPNPAKRNCALAEALLGAWQPSTGVGALSKKTALLTMYSPLEAPGQPLWAEPASAPCIDQEALIGRIQPLVEIAEGEAHRLRRWPFGISATAQRVAERTVLTQRDVCFANAMRDGSIVGDRHAVCTETEEAPAVQGM